MIRFARNHMPNEGRYKSLEAVEIILREELQSQDAKSCGVASDE